MANVPFADNYPFLDILWSMLVFVGLVFWIWLSVTVFADIFRRHDMGGFAKALWIVFVIFLPLLGVLVYLIAYNDSIADRNLRGQQAARAAFDEQVREAAGTSGPATEIATAKSLLDAGAITDAEYDALKTKAVGAPS
jgi:hypothetical protein